MKRIAKYLGFLSVLVVVSACGADDGSSTSATTAEANLCSQQHNSYGHPNYCQCPTGYSYSPNHGKCHLQ